MKNQENVKRGKQSRKAGKAFESFVRKDLTEQGWNVSRWDNQVEFNQDTNAGKLVQAKPKFNPFTRSVMNMSSGFPDFICFRRKQIDDWLYAFEVFFVESKMTGELDKKEKEMARWYLENNYCSQFLTAKKVKEGRKVKVEYINFIERYK